VPSFNRVFLGGICDGAARKEALKRENNKTEIKYETENGGGAQFGPKRFRFRFIFRGCCVFFLL